MLEALVRAQNSDGGWGYVPGGPSWAEPTVYALLALKGAEAEPHAVRRGQRFLAQLRRPDGGLAPRPGVEESTWVTALYLLLEPDAAGEAALAWVLRQTGRESTLLHRIRMKLLGVRQEYEAAPAAWPWYPGTAAWLVPTAVTLLALRKVRIRRSDPRIAERIREGERFLLVRRCADGGWNHGASRALGFQSFSYPETTGLALLALAGMQATDLEGSLRMAERHLKRCRSWEGIAWLDMGLRAHGRPPGSLPQAPERTVMDTALRLLAELAARGANPLLARTR
ncbi:MAG: terpene cyclase/mutase family protein [Bryobacterales bacterium]|nr:terpene cyclase/mutase family protein [Bryobacteraceae bacterium]MDW8130161.1 terpene cyclase/mutase family protein [Bryobacterales bacterium]